MTEILTSLVKPAMEELGGITFAAIKRQFNYLCCFKSNIQSLKVEAEKLDEARLGLQMQVEVAENNAKVIVPEVKTWLENASNKIQVDKSGIDDEIPTLKKGCLGIKSRFLLSRKAKKITEEMKQLLENCKEFNEISTPPPPAAQVSIPLGTTYHEFQSRKQIEEEIMEALRAKKFRTMGICGMGGVGKTTMAKKIMNRVREENLFDEIFMVVVRQQVNMLKIQDEMAESLGLKFDDKTLSARANKLRTRLTGTKKILIVLDDVWEKLKLEELGIPCQSDCTGCIILLTSRNKDVLEKIDVEKVCAMETLFETEAWVLFREKVGTCVDDPNLLSTAKKVVKECEGLPIALITVGSALKDRTSAPIWEDALQQLQSSNPEDLPDFIKDVYNALELSYTFLENRHAKSLFLLCCLFPEDDNIELEELALYCMGLRMFGEIRNLERVRNRVITIVDTLKSRFLLLKGEDERHVRMHDVVRDVANYIASKEGLVDVNFHSMHWPREYSHSNCKWISSMLPEKISGPCNPDIVGLNFPSLCLFMNHYSYPKGYEFDFSLFQGMKELNVLSFRNLSLKLLPQEIQLLKNLQTLRLENCTVNTLSFVGELLNLEILCCKYCDDIEDLPVEMGKLNKLKLLEFSRCGSLKIIPPGVISKLVDLEEFKMYESFSRWGLAADVEGQERRNAGLKEFENLTKMTCLVIEIQDFNIIAEERCFSTNIVKYLITINEKNISHPANCDKSVFMKLPRGEINLGSWVVRFLGSANDLRLEGDGWNNLDISHFFQDQSNSFKNLQRLELDELPALKHLWKRPIRNVSLDNLRDIKIHNCVNLRNLFSLKIANNVFLQLETLKIGSCEMMEEVFSNVKNENDGEQCHMITFPKLKKLSLSSLPSLTTFCKGIDDSSHLFFSQKVLFPMLESLELHGLEKIEEIWKAPISDDGSNSFNNLRKLKLSDLPALKSLFKSPNQITKFTRLEKMRINNCPKLTYFGQGIEVPMLRRIENNQNSAGGHDDDTFHLFCSQEVSFGSLKEIDVRSYDISNMWCHQIPVGFFSQLESLVIMDCDVIRSLFSFSIAKNLVNLKDLTIYECKEMVKVIEDDEEMLGDQKPHLLFPRLKVLYLWKLPKLQNFCNWRRDIQLPSLECVHIIKCPSLELEYVIFDSLKEINITQCDGTRSLFSSSIAKILANLQYLFINDCKEMVKVIEDDEEMLGDQKPHLLFPSLETLDLQVLPKLQSFCNWRRDIQLPSLERVVISDCPLLELESISTPN